MKGAPGVWIRVLLVLAVTAVVGVILLPNIMPGRGRSLVSRVKNDQRSLATGLEAYYIEHNSYPGMVPLRFLSGDPAALYRAGGGDLMTAATGTGPDAPGLTTPVSYVTSMFPDPFAPERRLPFAYYRGEYGWILLSPGPDRDYDMRDPSKIYTSSESQPSSATLLYSTMSLTAQSVREISSGRNNKPQCPLRKKQVQ